MNFFGRLAPNKRIGSNENTMKRDYSLQKKKITRMRIQKILEIFLPFLLSSFIGCAYQLLVFSFSFQSCVCVCVCVLMFFSLFWIVYGILGFWIL